MLCICSGGVGADVYGDGAGGGGGGVDAQILNALTKTNKQQADEVSGGIVTRDVLYGLGDVVLLM